MGVFSVPTAFVLALVCARVFCTALFRYTFTAAFWLGS